MVFELELKIMVEDVIGFVGECVIFILLNQFDSKLFWKYLYLYLYMNIIFSINYRYVFVIYGREGRYDCLNCRVILLSNLKFFYIQESKIN